MSFYGIVMVVVWNNSMGKNNYPGNQDKKYTIIFFF
jgi:hypothetical protein